MVRPTPPFRNVGGGAGGAVWVWRSLKNTKIVCIAAAAFVVGIKSRRRSPKFS